MRLNSVKNPLTTGLTSYQIKMIAVFFMTLDHLAAYGFEIPLFTAYYTPLRVLGRIAAPLFLFTVTESVRHTRSRKGFLLRLYLGAVGVGLFTAVTNFLFSDSVGMFIQSNILFTFFYVALYITLIEQIISAVREHDGKRGILAIAGMFATCLVDFAYQFLYHIDFSRFGFDLKMRFLCKDLIDSFLESPLRAEYSVLFIIMGVIQYFARNKYWKTAVLVGFSIFSFCAGPWDYLLPGSASQMTGFPQCCMILAAPFMLLYNGEKGKDHKWFFYFYYPLHRYAISLAAYIYLLLFAA